MALVKFGTGIVQMSGSIAGVVHARNRFGNYTRPRTKPVNPRSQRQMGIRTIMMFLAEQWRESPMDDDIRTAWGTYASSFNWTNRLGEQVTLTGYNAFIQCNASRITGGLALLTAAPTTLGLPPGDPTFLIGDVSAGAQTFICAFDDGFDWCTEEGGALLIYQGMPQSASHNFFNGPWRFSSIIEGIDPGGIASPVAAIPQNGFTFVEGQKIWWQARILRKDGRISTPFRCDPITVIA